MSNTKIDQLGIDPKTVRLWVNKGDGNVNDSKRVGRPTKPTPNTKNKIRNLVKDKIWHWYSGSSQTSEFLR
ncbi:hypothetical protein C0J52_18021 [Blattella germanica]|nr:hypothetical protein C0J52_18021 [Blattella germanica]